MKIVIVGGGTSGWMTAAAFCKHFTDWETTIITDGEPIGVGESTTPHIQQYLQYMDIEDFAFLTKCRGTYKSSSRFEDFASIGSVFHYPNGQFPPESEYNEWMIAKEYFPEKLPSFAETFMPFVTVAEQGKMPLNHSILGDYDLNIDKSFHFDASLFVKYLKKYFCDTENFKHIEGKVKKVDRSDDIINSIIVDGRRIFADLFIDCTGQKSILTKSEWVDYNTILTDTALVTRTEYIDKDKEMVPYTNARGMSSGWQWTIPTYDFISRGYVFSSKYQTLDDAANEFGWDDFNIVKFKNGRRDEAWVGNCVSIGLSYGFIEPLESTGLFNSHHGILALTDILSKEPLPAQFARDRYNYNMAEHMDGWREFVEAHYYYSHRRDTPFWRAVTDMKYPIKGAHADVQQIMVAGDRFPSEHMPIVYILAGSGYTNVNKRLVEYFKPPFPIGQKKVDAWIHNHARILKHSETQPTMYQFLSEQIYPRFGD
tara:strand:+ start:601 stop:2052 length:1452 start_codon:yes stop_codon:yes gene_type:complete